MRSNFDPTNFDTTQLRYVPLSWIQLSPKTALDSGETRWGSYVRPEVGKGDLEPRRGSYPQALVFLTGN